MRLERPLYSRARGNMIIGEQNLELIRIRSDCVNQLCPFSVPSAPAPTIGLADQSRPKR